MKIKQSFIDICGEITVKQIMEISFICGKSTFIVLSVLQHPNRTSYVYTTEILKAIANVLEIDLSDIYEVEQLPDSLTEKL